MATRAHVRVHDEVREPSADGHSLCFQRCTFDYGDGRSDEGYRFIWRTPEGNLKSTRGQARIPDASTLNSLTEAARKAGWFQ